MSMVLAELAGLLACYLISPKDVCVITNLPIARFASYLRHNNKLDEYMELLIGAFNAATIDGLMCRNTISLGCRREVYDCDFNQQLNMQ